MGSERTKCLAFELSAKLDERLELLMAVAYAFAQPVPDYQPEFRHVRDRLSAHEVGHSRQLSETSGHYPEALVVADERLAPGVRPPAKARLQGGD